MSFWNGSQQSTPVIVIGEINTGHFGDLEQARKAVREAKKAGVNAIKFQSWNPRSLYSEKYLRDNRIEARFYERLSLSPSDLAILRAECDKQGILFGSTVYDPVEAHFLAELSADFVKIASMDLVNPPLMEVAASLGLPLIVSTGMCTPEEVESALANFLGQIPNLYVLHCISLYPTEPHDLQLDALRTLQKLVGHEFVGLSDHTTSSEAAMMAIALGARVIEKHFTLDKSRPGFDNSMALSLSELSMFVAACRRAEAIMKPGPRFLGEAEHAQRLRMRRSWRAARNLPAGHVVTEPDMLFLRPGDGLGFTERDQILGRELKCDVEEGDALRIELFDFAFNRSKS